MSETFTLSTRDGLALEARIDEPPAPGGVLVFCHPHPQMGGTMNAPLLRAVTDHLVDRGWAVLRFNFRGIGASEGTSGTGLDEVADAIAAIAEARSRFTLPIAIAGWSFGAGVAVRAAAEDGGLDGCVLIAPPAETKEGITEGLPPPDGAVIGCPMLVVCGANDELVSPPAVAAWAEKAPATYVEVRGANHFFWARYDSLAKTIGDFLDQIL